MKNFLIVFLKLIQYWLSYYSPKLPGLIWLMAQMADLISFGANPLIAIPHKFRRYC